jgi:hypothetical protein
MKKNAVQFEMSLTTKKIDAFYFSDEETLGSKHFKLGILDTLNADLYAETQDSFIGACKVKNTILDEAGARLKINKVKYECKKPRQFSGEYKRKEAMLNSVIDRQIGVNYTFLNNLIETVVSTDRTKVFFEMMPQYYQVVNSK